MLPGIRFLLAAILLSISVVVFGLGAAALLRAAHEDFASNPSWRVTPETRFAQNEMPTLALLRVDAPPADKPADAPVGAAPETSATAPAPSTAPANLVAAVSPAPEKTETLPVTDAMKTEAPPQVTAPPGEPLPAAVASESPSPVDQPSKPDAAQDTRMAATETGDAATKTSDAATAAPEPVKPEIATSEASKPEATPEIAKPEAGKPEQASAPPVTGTPPTKVAKLDTPAVKIEEPSPTKAEARKAAERAAEKEKARAEKAEKKAKARRRLAAQRARAAKQAAAQRAADPFGQTQPPAVARTP